MPQDYTLINGHLHSPYFIFVRAAGRFTDEDILRLLGFVDWVACSPGVDEVASQIYLTEDDAWIHIADDWLYSLWNKGPGIVANLHKSIPDASIFACSVGDADWSFGFSYYSLGRLQRQYAVEDPNYDKDQRVIVENFGQPLPGERALSEIDNEQDYVLLLAAKLGVKLNHNPEAIRCYTPRK